MIEYIESSGIEILPDDYLAPHLHKLQDIYRYEGELPIYIKEVFYGKVSVLDHVGNIFRLYRKTFPDHAFGCEKARIERIIWLHDLPEISPESPDTPEVLAVHTSQVGKEIDFVEQMFSPEDFEKFLDFIVAEQWLKERNFEVVPSWEAVIAKVYDFMEGNITYYRLINTYLENHLFDERLILSIETGLRYMHIESVKYITALEAMSVDNEMKAELKIYLQKIIEEHEEEINQYVAGGFYRVSKLS